MLTISAPLSRGICYTMTAADTEVKEVEKMFAVNVFGPMRMVHLFHRMIIKSSSCLFLLFAFARVKPCYISETFRSWSFTNTYKRERSSTSAALAGSYPTCMVVRILFSAMR